MVAAEPARLEKAEWREVWRPGQPLPEAPPLPVIVRPPAPQVSGNRVCSSCGFSGRRVDFATDRRCPGCAYEWD